MNEDSTFRRRRVAALVDIRDFHIFELGSFSVKRGLCLVAKGIEKNWLRPFVAFQFTTNFNVTGYDGDVECFSDFDNSILCTPVQVFRNSTNF